MKEMLGVRAVPSGLVCPRTYLVHVVVVDDGVEAAVEIVEHVHNFHRCAVLAQGGETHDVAEVYRHFLVQLRFHHAALLQTFHHRAAQRREKGFSTLNMAQVGCLSDSKAIERLVKCERTREAACS